MGGRIWDHITVRFLYQVNECGIKGRYTVTK